MFLRIAVPTLSELIVLNAFVGLVQLGFLVAAVRSSRRGARPAGPAPKVVVVAPCKGAVPDLERNAASLLDQDYGGPAEYIFVLPAEDDPGRGPIAAAAARAGAAKVQILASGLVPTRSSGKAGDLAWALGRLPPDAELAVFAELDVCVGRCWLREAAAPLSDPSIGVVTTIAVPVPRSASLWGVLRMLWYAGGLPYFSALGMVSGQTMAVRVADLRRWDLRGEWERSFADDLALGEKACASGAGIRFVTRAMPVQDAPCGAAEFWGVFNRWWMCFRVHRPVLFVLCFLLVAFKAACLVRSIVPSVQPALLAAAVGGDFVYYAAALAWLAGAAPRSFAALPGGAAARLAAALAAPVVMPWVYLAHFAASVGTARVRWGDRSFLLRGPRDVVVEPRVGGAA